MKKAFFWIAMAMPIVAAAWSLPMQLELRVPFEPTAFTSAGRAVLTYELNLTNFSDKAIDLRRIEVFDADEAGGALLAAFDGQQIDPLLRNPGARQVNAGATVVVFMQVTLDPKARMPKTVRHRVSNADSSVEGAVIGTRHVALKLLQPPVRGAEWHASDGPSNDPDNHHRRNLFVLEGHPSISARFATDWFLKKNGHTYDGDLHDRRSHHSYDQPVYAVANGTVVSTRDGRPDNVPGFYPGANLPAGIPMDFKPPADLSLDTATGNFIVLDLGEGQFAHYNHLQPGSLRVKPGDHVKSGELLARIGISGDPNVPHLHFEVTTSPRQFIGEGVPYLIDRFRAKAADGSWQTFTRELPARNMMVDFGERVH
jgi:murein DD-endopeptidase MepM/ murein hydrolase activator NlpD